MKFSYWHFLILLAMYFEASANTTDVKNSSENISDVEFTTRKIFNNIMKLNPGIKIPAINTSLPKPPEIGNNSFLHHWRKHIHHSKRHRKSLESPKKHHIASLSSQKSNLSLILPMNWKQNRLNISPFSTNDSQQVFTNLIHRFIDLNNNLSLSSAHAPINYNSEAINAENLDYHANNTNDFIASYMANNSANSSLAESHTVCNMTGNLNNQSCNDNNLLNSAHKNSESLKENLSTPSSFLNRLIIRTEPPEKSKAFELNEQLLDDPFLRILERKPLFPIPEKDFATTKRNFIIIDDLGYFGDPNEETPIIKSREIFHPRPSLIDYIFGEKIDNPVSEEIENQMKYIDLWNLETNKTRTIEPRGLKIKFKISEDINDHNLSPWGSNNIYLPKISEPQYNLKTKSKKEETKVNDRFLPLRSIKQPKSKVLNESDFQSAFLSTFYISIAICGIFFAIALWWRRFSVIKKSNFTTISDSVHLSPTPSSPLAARQPGQSRV